MAGIEPRLSQFGPAISWLIAKEVSAARLATLFSTTSENIRVIAFRARHKELAATAHSTALGYKPSPELARKIGIRPALDDAAWTPARTRKLDWLKEQIDKTVATYAARYDFMNGARTLRRILPFIGYAGDARRIALQGLVHQHLSWFLVHGGRCVSAAGEARRAQDLWRVAWHESGSHDYGRGFVQAALIESHASLLSRRPDQALQTLEIAHHAAESIPEVPGSDHYRQRGVALLQLREDTQAALEFRKSAETMEKLGEATLPAQVLMTGARHSSLLGGLNCCMGYDVLSAAKLTFGEASLESTMALHWAAAACLSSDSDSLIQAAVAQMEDAAEPAPQFGHQVTIRKLLTITPDLGFDNRLGRVWVRRALYENAFRDT